MSTLSFSLLASAAVVILGRTCSCLQFTYPSFDTTNKADFNFSTGSTIANGSLHITPSTGNISHWSGRVVYAREALKLWNSKRTAVTSFRTEFVLNILPWDKNIAGEGLAFILTNNPSLPKNSSGQWLGVCNNQTDGSVENRIIAFEFDTRKNYEDDLDNNHFGIDFNSIKSVRQQSLSNQSILLSSGSDVWVEIKYNGRSMLFQATLIQYSTSGQYFSQVSAYINLSALLLDEDIYLGFAGSTGAFTQLNQIKSWNFTTIEDHETRHGRKLLLVLAALIIFSLCLFVVLFMWRRLTRQRRLAYRNLEKMIDAHGPVKFKLKELRHATSNFSPTRKLGRGGFGTVYLGYINRMNMEVAVKRVSTSNQKSSRGEQEFVAEVNTISKLSHRNLVKLIGLCHEGAELLLIYEYFPMGSLDKLLYASARTTAPELTWDRRYKIICGVASALDYLHHGSSKRILHRDVKASNVMLDEEYNAKLGDFGLARIIQHDSMTHHSTQAVAGTRAYMAYEAFFTGRASLDTDVYAFGVFVMEVVSGRSPSSSVSYNDDRGESSGRGRHATPMYIMDWTWRLYGEGKSLDAADTVLGGAYNEAQVDCVVRLALACCHPNPRERPSMRTVVQVVIGGAPGPEPPSEKPAFVWPPSGKQREIELPDVGVLFTGGQPSFCSVTSSSLTGR
ncbi:probable L-type lectin-domain containing receptor kinase S.5 isoform X2 [Brachypodium distachyon]|nr:probable L-type lectin-domain containing receptor kinase S.5 isoform X2 [Brachypodium distachyon]XP_024311883.1 probable L-type lectin-domain containing receptor kinase S.5 isoform X2 [Brachypodium distachyon]XP_024311884.1 probable L-type lectin-domain containing receptor kinase S.5 isoform X2 [Brachypodium distachyon]|eukprot:XP_003581567.1 probable L-type lectin-domain containing receptor kinase S.5 isoform X2 [Brachypodium distachyon]